MKPPLHIPTDKREIKDFPILLHIGVFAYLPDVRRNFAWQKG